MSVTTEPELRKFIFVAGQLPRSDLETVKNQGWRITGSHLEKSPTNQTVVTLFLRRRAK